MAEQNKSPQYLLASEQEIGSLAHKLLDFSTTLGPVEQSLFMERIKRSMPNAEFQEAVTLEPSLSVFGGWLNSVVPGSVLVPLVTNLLDLSLISPLHNHLLSRLQEAA